MRFFSSPKSLLRLSLLLLLLLIGLLQSSRATAFLGTQPNGAQALGGCSVSGLISENTTWNSATCNPYIVDGVVIVNEGVTLTIEAGTTVQFESDKALIINGELLAQGTEGNLITFTSNQANPMPGDWDYIYFSPDSTDATFDGNDNYTGGSIIQYAVIEYAGGSNLGNNGALRLEAAAPFIDHSTIRHNEDVGVNAWDEGGNIHITNNTISENSGSGIYISQSSVTISDNTITTNSGGGLYISYSDAALITNNMFANNTTNSRGGGLHIENGTNTISNNTITGNTGSPYGGGIYIENGTNTINNNNITGNTTSSSGGGIYTNNFGVNTISNNIITDNTVSSGTGGGLLIRSNTATILNNTITGNTASQSGGGLIAGGNHTISGNTIGNNEAGSDGGGILLSSGSNGEITNNVITDNMITGVGEGGGIYLNNGSRPPINNNDIYNNSSGSGDSDGLYNANVYVGGGGNDVNAENNYWGVAECGDVEGLVWHLIDDSDFSQVDFDPCLTSPIGGSTPTPTPTGSPATATSTPTNTPTATATVPTNTPTNTPTVPTNTPTATPTVPTNTPTATPTASTSTPTATPTPFTPTPGVTSTATATPSGSVELALEKTVSSDTAQPGDTLTYQITLSAEGGSATVQLEDSLPDGLTYVEGTLTGGASYDADNHQIGYNGSVAPGSPLQISYQATVDSGVALGSILYNAVMVTNQETGEELDAAAAVSIPEAGFDETLVLLYVNGDNNLSDYVLSVINRAEQRADNPNVKVLLLLDGPAEGDAYLYDLEEDINPSCPNYMNPTCNGRYVLGQNLWEWQENIASVHSLFEFLSGAHGAYPNAEQIVLSLVGHGGGWAPTLLDGQPKGHGGQSGGLGGLLWDNDPGTSLSTAELAEALTSFHTATGRKIDLLYLDACLMGMSEVAYEVRDSVDYLLASESWSWTSFRYDEHLDDISATSTADEIGEAWLANEATKLHTDNYPFTYSLLDLSQMTTLREAQDSLASELIDVLPADKEKIETAFENSACFDSNGDHYIVLPGNDAPAGLPLDNYCDLHSFAEQIKTQFSNEATVLNAAQGVQDAIATVVIAEDHHSSTPWNYSNQEWLWEELGGISSYVPFVEDEWRRRYYTGSHLQSAQDGQWDDFLLAYWEGNEPPEQPECLPDCALPQGPLSPVPTISEVYPNFGLSNTPNEITVQGSNFVVGTTISLNTSPPTVISTLLINDTYLSAIVPAELPVGTYDVTVTNPDDASATLEDGYTVSEFNDDLFGFGYELWSNPLAVREGEEVDLGLLIHRQGGQNVLENVTTRFYLGDPTDGGTLIGEGVIKFLSPRGDATTPDVPWTAPAEGTYPIYAVIDPDNTIQEGNEQNNTVSRLLTVLPPNPDGDESAPRVDSFTINDGVAETDERTVSLDTIVSDPAPSSGIASLYFIEYKYSQGAGLWVFVRGSGWLPYETSRTDYPWLLSPNAGMKYIQAWASDQAGNISDFPFQRSINYNPPTDSVFANQARIYRYDLVAGEELTAKIERAQGDPDLYVWPPDHDQGRPPWVSNLTGDASDEVTFVAPVDGTYQVEVYGYTNAEFRLTVDTPTTHSPEAHVAGLTGDKPERTQPILSVNSVPSLQFGPPSPPSIDPTEEPTPETGTLYLPMIIK